MKRTKDAPRTTLCGIVAVALALAAASAAFGQSSSGAACGGEDAFDARVDCFLDAAKAAGSAETCEQAPDDIVRFYCITNYAEHIGDIAPCDRLTHHLWERPILRDTCVTAVALVNHDPQLCERVRLSTRRDTCYLYQVREAGADPALCDRIELEMLVNTCRDGAK